MTINFYDKLFFPFYDMMSRQGNIDPNDDRFEGLIGGSIFFSLIPYFILMDFAVIFRHSNFFVTVFKLPLVLIFLALIICINLFFFCFKKRYLFIDEKFRLMTKRKRRYYSAITWILLLVLIIGFGFLMKLSVTRQF
jgi:hypothetical protein